jgi:ERCC4-type nuclease
MNLYIDTRESQAIKELNNTEYNVIPLDIGDFQIKSVGDTFVIFERKLLSDLLSSIKDGRYKEQSLRLNSHSLENHKFII